MISFGGDNIGAVYYGGESISAVYSGADLVWSAEPTWILEDLFSYPGGTWVDQDAKYTTSPNAYLRINGKGHVWRDAPNNNVAYAVLNTKVTTTKSRIVLEAKFNKPSAIRTQDGLHSQIVLATGITGANSDNTGTDGLYIRREGGRYNACIISDNSAWIMRSVTAEPAQSETFRIEANRADGTWKALYNGTTFYEGSVPEGFKTGTVRAQFGTTEYRVSSRDYRGTMELDEWRFGTR